MELKELGEGGRDKVMNKAGGLGVRETARFGIIEELLASKQEDDTCNVGDIVDKMRQKIQYLTKRRRESNSWSKDV